ncbi:glycosyltransferase [Paradonghicola geojensis]|nr:glycosyltransferase [Marivivens geojensis]
MHHTRSFNTALAQPLAPSLSPLGKEVIRRGFASAQRVALAERDASRQGCRLADTLRLRLSISAAKMAEVEAAIAGVGVVDPCKHKPDTRLLHQIGATYCIENAILPWRSMAGEVIILTSRPEDFARHREKLSSQLGAIRWAVTTEAALHAAIRSCANDTLARLAEEKVASEESCRGWNARQAANVTLSLIAFAIASLFAWFGPTAIALFGVMLFWTVANTALKAAAVIMQFRPDAKPAAPTTPHRLPIVTIMVPLYHESEIAVRLVNRLSALDYPHDLLDVCLLLEADDQMTRQALLATTLPRFMRAIVVPQGTVKTKPRALNYGLSFARGSIIGVYDAEDAPDPQQIRAIVARFAAVGPEVACLQGMLDFYNAKTNWLSRCFALEYATWFRVILPGLERLGFLIPLGGTTLFFRRSVLEKLGGWDAHNVTEDADLGVRFARHGYRTEIVRTVTGEEANSHVWPWIKQRSRWLKGYAITYGVHMRNPRQLLCDLGWRKFLGFQVQFLGTLTQFVTAPMMWSFWAIPLGFWHPVREVLPPSGLITLSVLFATSEAVHLTAAILGARASRRLWLLPWVPTLHLYFPLASLAAYKGLGELLHRPFYWDKTAHGKFGGA